MKLKIFPKTFISSLSLIVVIVIIAFTLISVLTPRFYRAYKQEALDRDLSELIPLLQNKDIDEIINHLQLFAEKYDYNITLRDEYDNTLFSRTMGFGMMVSKTQISPAEDAVISGGGTVSGGSVSITIDIIAGNRTFIDNEARLLTLNLSSSMQPIDEANTVLLRVLPYVLLISLGLGAAASLIYAKTITAPVKAIGTAALRMRSLEKDTLCSVKSSDEIGELAMNINELYGRLLSTITDLQNEMQNTAAADKEKIDFMLTVSHELKTPLTSVKGMIEGMIYNIGVYKDRDEYLTRCAENIDALTALLNEILDASRLELSPAPEDYADTSIYALSESIIAAQNMIAKSRQVVIYTDIDESVSVMLPSGLFSKALSNIISNAVQHADEGGEVRVYMDKGQLIIENTCTPLPTEDIRRVFEPFCKIGDSKGHGLGLYLTERILKVCGFPFEFVPFERGMRFVIYIKQS